MSEGTGSGPTVVVVGASLGGLAAAVRLAKLGHRVTIVDRAPSPAPAVPDLIELPAAWRDLFRKSGRILDAVLAEASLDLVPAPGTVLSDGTVLPTDRGEQYAVLSEAYGTAAAVAWRDLLDSLDDVWQIVRRTGLEADLDLDDPQVAHLLAGRTTVAGLAARIAPPSLRQVVLGVARDRGVDPDAAPAWWATQLSVRRTFSSWRVVANDGTPRPGSALAALLLARAARRGVDLRQGTVTSVRPAPGRVTVTLAGGSAIEAPAVVSAVDLWQHRDLTAQPAPAVRRRLGPLRLRGRLQPSPTMRPRWELRDTWRALEPVSGRLPSVWYAGSGTVAGDLPWARLLVGALATYGVHEALTGEDVRPTNKSGHRARAARAAGSA